MAALPVISLVSIAVGAVSAFVLYQITKVVHRLLLHPLCRFPGPKLAAATFWYEAYFDAFKAPGGQFIYHLDYLHSVYGPVVRCSPEEIHIKDSEFFDTLYAGSGHARDKWWRANQANQSPGATASTLQHNLHRMRRGALNPFFSKKAVMELEQSTRSKVNALCEKIDAYAAQDRVVDLGAGFTAVTLDVITEYCFDACYNCIEDPDLGKWKRLMSGIFEGAPLGKTFPRMMALMQSLPRPVATTLNPDLSALFESLDLIHKQAREIYEAEKGAVDSKTPQTEERAKTIFHGIMDSSLPPEEKTIDRLADEAFVVIVAGGETTARVLTVIFSYLLQDADLLHRLRTELDKAMNGHLPASRVLENVPLVRAVIQEGVRIAAPVTNRQILIAPDEDLSCHGWVLQRGVSWSRKLQKASSTH